MSVDRDHGLRSVVRMLPRYRRPPVTRGDWFEQLRRELELEPGSPDFDLRFARHLHRQLLQAGFPRAAAALLSAAADLADHCADRAEFDALVDLGLELLVRAGEES